MFARKQDSDQLIDQKKHKWVALYIKREMNQQPKSADGKRKKVDR